MTLFLNHKFENVMTCSNCNTQNDEGSFFCGECGNSLKEIAAIATQTQPAIEEPATAPESKIVDEIRCRNCGKALSADAFACMGCGLPPYKGRNNCQKCGAATHQDAVICIKCGVMLENEAPIQNNKQLQNPVAPVSGAGQEYRHVEINTSNRQTNVVVVGGEKSMAVGLLLAFFFGPLGLMYSSVAGGLILFFVGLIGIIIWPLLVVTWLGSIIWAVIAVGNHNSSLNNRANRYMNS